MDTKPTPFEQLTLEDQKSVIDCAALVIALTTRVPTVGKGLYDYIVSEVLRSYKLSNAAKYAFRQVSEELMANNWEFTATKKGIRLVTKFTKLQGENGEIHIQ